jgi:hypothetical protein
VPAAALAAVAAGEASQVRRWADCAPCRGGCWLVTGRGRGARGSLTFGHTRPLELKVTQALQSAWGVTHLLTGWWPSQHPRMGASSTIAAVHGNAEGQGR